MANKVYKGWHFVSDKLRDGFPVPKDGVWLKYKGPLKMCETGLHWSKEPFDALQYAPGATLCQVEARGETLHDNDKSVSRERRIVRRMDATELLRYFARMQALSVIHLYPNGTDDVVFDYLMTGEESLRAAAWAAARDAARDAAWDAAGDAQREHFNHLVSECFQ